MVCESCTLRKRSQIPRMSLMQVVSNILRTRDKYHIMAAVTQQYRMTLKAKFASIRGFQHTMIPNWCEFHTWSEFHDDE